VRYIVGIEHWTGQIEDYKIYIYSFSAKAKKKICVFMVTRPTLIFASDPMNFYTEFG
jgi:hypothetical protein